MSYYGSGNPQGGYGYGREESGDGCGREQSGGYGYGRGEAGGYGRQQESGYGRQQESGYGRQQESGYGREQSGGYGREESGYGRGSGAGYGHGQESGGYGGGYGSSGYGGAGGQESYGNESYGRPSGGYGEYGREEQGGYGRGDQHHRRHDQDTGAMNRPASGASHLEGQQVMKIYCEANPDYYVTVTQEGVVLVPGNESNEEQQFVKDCKWGSRVQDEAGFPAFAIVNKATGMALKHGDNALDKVTVQPYDPESLDESVLWTLSDDVGNGYQCLRPVGNIHLNMDAHHGDTKVRAGTELILFKWKKQENQKWKIVPIGSGDGGRPYEQQGGYEQGGYGRPSYGY